MPQKFEIRKGFMRFQRLGPVKFGEQSRWSTRAPGSSGLWAFPFPHFYLFYAYHRYLDLLPKELQGRRPTHPKWWRRERLKGEPRYEGSYEIPSEYDDGDYPISSMDEILWEDGEGPFDRDPYPTNGHVISEFYAAQEHWINTVGKKIMPLREFWYRGELYSHFNRDGSVGGWTSDSKEEGNDWTRMSTDELARHMRKPGGVIYSESHWGDGKPRSYSYSKDHLEVFIPRGAGEIRHRL